MTTPDPEFDIHEAMAELGIEAVTGTSVIRGMLIQKRRIDDLEATVAQLRGVTTPGGSV